jgi:hypothetical protein
LPKHRGLALDRFIASISPDVIRQYVDRLAKTAPTGSSLPSGWQLINGEQLDLFMATPENAEISAIIREDFQRVNDISEDGTGVVIRAYQKFGIDLDDSKTPEELTMLLFLDQRDAFEFAWSRYLLYASTAKLSVHPMPLGHLTITDSMRSMFEDGVRHWFVDQAKGEQCLVHIYEDNGELVILVQHGTYVRTMSFWKGKELSVASFRPALEDVLVYEPDTSLLRIKASAPKDREEYLRLFASRIAGDDTLSDSAQMGEVFTLGPLQDRSFDFAGDGPIVGVELRSVRMRLYGVTNVTADFRSPNVLDSLRYDLQGLDLSSGLLLQARFHFRLQYPGEKPTSITFTIQPPATTDLAERRHVDAIHRYLEAQGVKLK